MLSHVLCSNGDTRSRWLPEFLSGSIGCFCFINLLICSTGEIFLVIGWFVDHSRSSPQYICFILDATKN